MKLKFLVMAPLFTFLMGCQNTVYFYHPNFNQQAFANDQLECEALANRMYPGLNVNKKRVWVNCMIGKGYTETNE